MASDRPKRSSENRIGRTAPWLASPINRPASLPKRAERPPAPEALGGREAALARRARPAENPADNSRPVAQRRPAGPGDRREPQEGQVDQQVPGLELTWSRRAWATCATCPSASSGSTSRTATSRRTRSCPTKKETIGELKRAAAKAGLVYLATDPDREGEAIAWHLQQALDLPDDRVRRVTFHEITERAVKDAFGQSGPINMEHGQRPAGAAVPRPIRRLSAQPAPLEEGRRRNLSAGRVQSVAVRLIADREREIRGFVTEEYWKIAATVSPAGSTDRQPTSFKRQPGRVRRRQVRGQDRGRRPRRPRRPAGGSLRRSPRSTRPRSSTRPTPRSRPARSSSRPRSGCGSRASRP